MGYDLHGINPLGYDKSKYPTLTKWENADWDEREKMTQKEQDKYWDELDKKDYETGSYFRANVWWWRRIWIFTCKVCDDVMTVQDMEAGDSNSGVEIDHETCMKMVPLMQVAIEDGSAMEYQKLVTEYIESAPKQENGMYEEEHFMANYPFNVEYFQDFTTFVERSGGFTID